LPQMQERPGRTGVEDLLRGDLPEKLKGSRGGEDADCAILSRNDRLLRAVSCRGITLALICAHGTDGRVMAADGEQFST
jgi:hypothetical protein